MFTLFVTQCLASDDILYITNQNDSPQSFLRCTINSNNNLKSCQSFNDSTGPGFNEPTGITFDKKAQTVYVTNQLGNPGRVSKCPLQDNKVFKTCQTIETAKGHDFITPAAIKIHPRKRIAYIVNGFVNRISQCPILENGNFGPCIEFDAKDNLQLLNTPISIEIHPTLDIAYITNAPFDNDSFIAQCALNKKGYITNCHNFKGSPQAPFSRPFDILIHPSADKAYITNLNSSTISICDLNHNGELEGCQHLQNSLLNAPLGLAFNHNKNKLYISNYGNDTLLSCSLSKSNNIENCKQIKTSSNNIFKQPAFIALE